MGVIVFNGISSSDLHTLVQHPPGYAIPERDCEVTHVPGRNGDIVVDNGTWKNVERTYNLAIDARKDSYSAVASAVANWLHSAKGYARLEDTYDQDVYRMAMYKANTNISNIYMKAGVFDISFDCKPQRFLKSGEKTVSFTKSKEIYNPTMFESKPSIIVYGYGSGTVSGTVSINGLDISIHNVVDGMVIDCELEDVYYQNANLNSNVTVEKFPTLKPGNNIITISSSIRIDIIPRWWSL